MEAHTCSTSAKSKDSHLTGVPAKIFYISFDPLECRHLIQHSIIPRGSGIPGRQKAKCTETVLDYNYYHAVQS